MLGDLGIIPPRRDIGLQSLNANLMFTKAVERSRQSAPGDDHPSGTRSRVRSCRAARKASPPPQAAPSRSLACKDCGAQLRDCSGSRPSRAARAHGFAKRPEALTACSSRSVPLSRSPRLLSAIPRLFWFQPSRAARARGCAPAGPRGRPRPPPRAAPSRSRARQGSRAQCPRLFWVVAQSSGTRSRVRSCSAARDRPRPPPRAAPSRSRARQGQKRNARGCSGSWPSRAARARGCAPAGRLAIGRHRLLQPRRPALALAEDREARAQGCSGSSPSRAARARGCAPAARRDRPRPPPRAAPSRSRARRGLWSALPRLFWVWPSRAARARGCAPAGPRDRRDRLLQPRRPALALAEGCERDSRDCSGRSPSSSGTRSRVCSCRAAPVGVDRLFEPRRATLAAAETLEDQTQVALSRSPREWRALPGVQGQELAVSPDC